MLSRLMTLAALTLAFEACGGSGGAPAGGAGSGGVSGAAGTVGASGTAGTGAPGSGGTTGGAGAPGAAGTGRADGGGADAGSGDASSGDAAFGGVTGLENLAAIKTSSGCGKDPGQPLGTWQTAPVGANKYMFGYALATPSTPKGSFTRRYFVKLPPTYDRDKPHRVVFEGPACGSVGYEVPAFDVAASEPNAGGDPHGEGVIQVGLTPDPTVWMTGCFDEQAGADTIEKAFIESLWPIVASSFCIDEHRVFMSGYDSGAWLANQLGHVYGSRLFRAIAPSAGGLAADAKTLQPCLAAGLPGAETKLGGCLPVPGIWWHDKDDLANPFTGTQRAIEEALVANRCGSSTFASGPKTPFATLQHATCVSYSACPPQFPVVLCTAVQQDHKNLLDEAVNLAAAWGFFKSF